VEQSLDQLLAGPDFESGPRPLLHIVPYGSAETPAATNESAREPIILMAGRDLYRKGFGVLVKALPRVIAARPGTRLVVVGDEYPHTRVVARVQARGLPVEFRGGLPRKELSQWYARASVLALPSWREAFGIVLIEAMSHGLPVAASSAGGIPEAVEPGVSGLLSDPGDVAGLAANLISLLGDERLRERLIRGGLERSRKFSIEVMGERLAAVYETMMERG
jgi:glycosyltransferase involved in cell wall biosynthesis